VKKLEKIKKNLILEIEEKTGLLVIDVTLVQPVIRPRDWRFTR